MRRRQVQRNVRSSVLGTVADSVEVRVLLSADSAMAAVDVVSDDAVSEEQPAAEQNLAVGEPECDTVDARITTDPVICDQPVAFQPDGSFGEADVHEADSTLIGDYEQAIAECGVLLQPEPLSFEPQVITCEPYNLTDESQQPFLLGVGENFEFGGASESGIVDVAAYSGVSRVAQFYNPVAFVSGSVTAEIELASAAEYDQDGNLIAPAVLHDRLSGIRYWQPKQFTLQSAIDLTELLQNYGISDYTIDDLGVWQIPVGAGDGVESLNSLMFLQSEFSLQTNDTVQAQVLLQPVDGQDAAPLLIRLPDSQIAVNYETGGTDPIWQTGEWQSGAVQIQASGAFSGTLEVAEAPAWDDAGQLISAGVLVDVATGLRYRSPQVLTVTGDSIDKLDQLLQDPQWAAGLDTKIVSVTEPDAQVRQLEIAPGTGYDALQLAGRLSEQTGLQVMVRLVSADDGGTDLEISTAETQLWVTYPVYMYARGSVGVGTPELQFGTEVQPGIDVNFGEVLTAVADGPVKFAEGVDVPVFAMGGSFGQPRGFAEREAVREAAVQMWVARTRQPQGDVVREVSGMTAADNTLSRVSGIAAAASLLPERSVPVSAGVVRQDAQQSVVQLSAFDLPAEVQTQPTESERELQLLDPVLRRRQQRPVPPVTEQGDVPADVPVQQPEVPVQAPPELPAAQNGPIVVPVSMSSPAIDSLMVAFAAAGLGH